MPDRPMTQARTPHPVDARGPLGWMALAGLQHVLVMYAGAVAVPVIVAGALRLPKEQAAFLVSAQLFACGIATVVQCVGLWRFGLRLPVIMGASFAAVSPMVTMAASGLSLNGLLGATIVGGAVTVAVAPFAGRLVRFFPPLVTGTVITVIGITLLRVGIGWAGGGIAAKEAGGGANIVVVALVLATILVVARLFEGWIASLAVLVGLGVGYAAALAFGMVDYAGVREATWIGLAYPFRFGAPRFDAFAIVPLCAAMLVVMIESTGLFFALGETCGRTVASPEVARGLAACGLGAAIAGALGALPCTASAQNVGLIGVTMERSRWIAGAAGAILVLLGLLPKLGALAASVPQPVLGAAGIVLFGMVAATGIRILARVDYATRHNLLIVAVSIGIGLIPSVAPAFFAQAPKWTGAAMNSGITLAAVSAALLNAWLNGSARRAGERAPGTGAVDS